MILRVAVDVDEGTFLRPRLACARLYLAVQGLGFLETLGALSLLVLMLLPLAPHTCSISDLLPLQFLLFNVFETARSLIRNFLKVLASILIFLVNLSLFLLHGPHMLIHILVQYVGSLTFRLNEFFLPQDLGLIEELAL